MGFPEKLQALRKERGLSQQALADRANVSQTAVYHWEKGLRNPKLEQIRRIATALEVCIGDLNPDWSSFSPSEIFEDISENEKDYTYVNPKELIKEQKLLDKYRNLNDLGQDKAIEQVDLLTKIPEYQKKE